MKARQAILASLPKEADRPKNIYARLAQILGYIGQVRKGGENLFHHYKYAKEGDLVEAVRPILSEYGIWIEQGLYLGGNIPPHERRGQVKRDRDGNVTGEVESLTILAKEFSLVWWNPETKDVERTAPKVFMGYGDDTSDKGANKAETSAVKYFLFKTFMIATGDDPEGDQRADQRAAGRDVTTAPVRVSARRGSPAQPAMGGHQAETTDSQKSMLGGLLRASGVRSTADAAKTIGTILGVDVPLDDKDPAASLSAFISGLDGQKMGKLIHDLKAQPPAEQPAAPVADAVGPDEVSDPGPQRDEPGIDGDIVSDPNDAYLPDGGEGGTIIPDPAPDPDFDAGSPY